MVVGVECVCGVVGGVGSGGWGGGVEWRVCGGGAGWDGVLWWGLWGGVGGLNQDGAVCVWWWVGGVAGMCDGGGGVGVG